MHYVIKWTAKLPNKISVTIEVFYHNKKILTKEPEIYGKDKKGNKNIFNDIVFENQNFQAFKLLN